MSFVTLLSKTTLIKVVKSRTENVEAKSVSHQYMSELWRENNDLCFCVKRGVVMVRGCFSPLTLSLTQTTNKRSQMLSCKSFPPCEYISEL